MNEKGQEPTSGDYVVVKAMENGVTVIGVTRGPENRFLHTEKLDEGEVWIAQFTEHVSAMKIRGAAKIYTRHGELESDKRKGEPYEKNLDRGVYGSKDYEKNDYPSRI